jgi:predicted transglutaminase-like cysteine proteinase
LPDAAGAAPLRVPVAPPQEFTADEPGTLVAAPPDAAGGASARRAGRLFGTVEFRSKLKGIPKWERVLRAYNNKPGIDGAFGPTRQREAQAWQKLKANMAKAGDLEKARAVNAFFNQWPYRLDSNVYGVSDYWATPDEFIKNSGDCEDYAITKLYALKQLGISPDNLRVVALRDNIRNLDHAVLAVYIGNTIYILDNVTKLVLTHDQFQHYFPYFSVNTVYKWAHIQPK